MAIGANRSTVLRMVLRQGMMLAVAGLGLGLLASMGASRGLSAVFPGGPGGDGRTDFVAFPLVAVTVLAVTAPRRVPAGSSRVSDQSDRGAAE